MRLQEVKFICDKWPVLSSDLAVESSELSVEFISKVNNRQKSHILICKFPALAVTIRLG